MSANCWINGEPRDGLPGPDHALHHGYGVFETLAVQQGRIVLEDYHLERLAQGSEHLKIPRPAREVLRKELATAAGDENRAVLKLVITLGGHGWDYRRDADSRGTRLISRYPWPDYPARWQEHGIRVRICDTHVSRNPRLAGIKHLSRIEQILARSEWNDADDIQEGLMLDEEGSVIEGTMTNVFAWLSHGVLATPALHHAGVAGVMRRYLMECADRAGIQLRVASMSLAELMQAEEIFVCNSIIGVWPVIAIGHWKYAVGPMTRQFMNWAAQAQ